MIGVAWVSVWCCDVVWCQSLDKKSTREREMRLDVMRGVECVCVCGLVCVVCQGMGVWGKSRQKEHKEM